MRTSSRSRAVLAAGLLAALGGSAALASSHREAPYAAMDAPSDLTDVYIFRSPDPGTPDDVVMVMLTWPFADPVGAPNYTQFGFDVLYQFNIDNDGDALADITWQYTFDYNGVEPLLGNPFGAFDNNDSNNPFNSFLYNNMVLSKTGSQAGGPNWKIVQRATVTKFDEDRPDPNGPSSYMRGGLLVGPENLGAPSVAGNNYAALETLHTVNDEKHMFGPMDDPFWVDLGLFNLLALRGLQSPPQEYVDTVKGFNVMAIVLQVPIANVVKPGNNCTAASTNDNCKVGFWCTTYRRVVQTGPRGSTIVRGPQLSRLGMPLTNELVVPLRLKDAFNQILTPDIDVAALAANNALGAVFQPELATLLAGDSTPGPDVPNTAIGVLGGQIPTGIASPLGNVRCDIVRIFLTGSGLLGNKRSDGWKVPLGLCGETPNIPDPNNATASDMLRLNVSTPATPYASQNRLGALGGDADGFPNGRRLIDDIVDIELRAVAGVLANADPNDALSEGLNDASCPACTGSPHNALSDAIGTPNQADDKNDVPFRSTFPYLARPHQGQNHDHDHNGLPGAVAGVIIGLQSIGIAALATAHYRRRRRARR